MKTVAVLIIIACTLFAVSFFVGLPIQEKSVSSSDSFSDQSVLQPHSDKTVVHPIQKECVLNIEASANDTFETDVFYKGELAGSPVVKTSVSSNYKLYDPGEYTVRFYNPNSTSIDLTYKLNFVETEYKNGWTFLWLRWPMFALGVLFMLLAVPVYFSAKFGRFVKNKYVKAGVVVAFGVLILFSYQIAGLVLRTSTPYVVTQGISMEPNLHAGDLVFIGGTSAQDLKVGDIVLYDKFALNTTTGESIPLPTAVLHRIIDTFYINGHWYFSTQGDNNPSPDERLVPEDGILGKDVYVVPSLGFVVAFLSNTETKVILLIMLAVAYFVVPEIRSELKKKKPKTSVANGK